MQSENCVGSEVGKLAKFKDGQKKEIADWVCAKLQKMWSLDQKTDQEGMTESGQHSRITRRKI